MNGIRSLIGMVVKFFSWPCEIQKAAVYKAGSSLSSDTESAGTLIFNFQFPKL